MVQFKAGVAWTCWVRGWRGGGLNFGNRIKCKKVNIGSIGFLAMGNPYIDTGINLLLEELWPFSENSVHAVLGVGVTFVYYCQCWANTWPGSSDMETSLKRGLNKETLDQVWSLSLHYWANRMPLNFDWLSKWKEISVKLLQFQLFFSTERGLRWWILLKCCYPYQTCLNKWSF